MFLGAALGDMLMQSWILENYRAALDEPGEWYSNREGVLFYYPLPGEDMSSAEVIAPVLDHFVAIRGDHARGEYVESITITGISTIP